MVSFSQVSLIEPFNSDSSTKRQKSSAKAVVKDQVETNEKVLEKPSPKKVLEKASPTATPKARKRRSPKASRVAPAFLDNSASRKITTFLCQFVFLSFCFYLLWYVLWNFETSCLKK